jgi:hypothetical protein
MSGLRATPRARGQTSGATLSPANSSHGCRQNFPTMDSGGSPLFSPAAGPRHCLVRALVAGRGSAQWQKRLSEAESRWGGEREDETPLQDGCMKANPARHAFTGGTTNYPPCSMAAPPSCVCKQVKEIFLPLVVAVFERISQVANTRVYSIKRDNSSLLKLKQPKEAILLL